MTGTQIKLGILMAIFSLSSCVTVRDSSETAYTEKWCFYDRAGIYRCTTCYGSECVCNVSAYDLCSFGVWERACRACYEGRYSAYDDLYFDARLDGCNPHSLCALCQEGASFCGPYPRAEWRIEVRQGPPQQHYGAPPSRGRSGGKKGGQDDQGWEPPHRGR